MTRFAMTNRHAVATSLNRVIMKPRKSEFTRSLKLMRGVYNALRRWLPLFIRKYGAIGGRSDFLPDAANSRSTRRQFYEYARTILSTLAGVMPWRRSHGR